MNREGSTGLKLGLIGCGRIARLAHLKILPRLPGVELAAIADTDSESLREAKALVPFAECFEDYRLLLSRPDLQAVVICLPNQLHAEATIAAIAARKNVYLEKPVATNLQDAESILNTSQNHGNVITMIGFQYRFHQTIRALKQMIQTGRFQHPVLVQTSFTTAGENLPVWKQSRATGGGVLPDLACHHVDLFRFLFDQEVTEVFAKTWTRRSESDCALLALNFNGGLRTQSFFSFSSVEENRFEIYDEDGKLSWETLLSDRWELTDPRLSSVRLKRLWNTAMSFTMNPFFFRRNADEAFLAPYRQALKHFVESAESNQKCKPDFEDALENIRVIQAAEESADSGKTIALDHRK